VGENEGFPEVKKKIKTKLKDKVEESLAGQIPWFQTAQWPATKKQGGRCGGAGQKSAGIPLEKSGLSPGHVPSKGKG